MEITTSQNGTEATIALRGCLDTAATAEFAKALDATAGAGSVVLDMTELEFIASSALRQLVATKKRRGAAFPIRLRGMNEVVGEVFDVTGLNEVFEVE